MKSIAVTKSDMALLSQEQLTQATFGALCQSFAMQILDRSGYEDGMYQRVALEFLEEESEQPQQPIQNVFNIDLKLVLETIRKEAQNQKREKKETEKLLEQVLRVQQAAEQKQIAMPHTSPVERTYLLTPQHSTVVRQSITVHNSFHQHGAAAQSSADRNRLQQAAGRAEQEVRAQFDLPGSQTRPIAGGPGSLSSRTERFVRQMQEGRDLMEPGSAQPRKQPVISGRKIEQSASLQQALQPAAEMELKTEPAQTQEPGKTAAEAVAEAMKIAVERQLQNLQSAQAPAETRNVRSPEQQDAGQLSQPEAHHKQGQPITTKTIGQKALQPQSATHIQQEIPAAQPAEKKNLHNQFDIDQQRFEGLSHTAAVPDKEAAMTAAREIRVTDQKVGTVPDALVQAPVPTQQNVIFETRPREELSFLQTEEAVQAERRGGTTPVLQTEGTDTKTGKAAVLSEEQQRERLLQSSLTRIREPLTQTIRQDIRITGNRTDRAAATGRPAEKMTQQNTTNQLQEAKAQNAVQPIRDQSSAAAQQPSGIEQSVLTKADVQVLSESQDAKRLDTDKEDRKPVSQRDIRVTGGGLETAAVQEQTGQPVISAVLPPVGSTEELAFRQDAETQAAAQPIHTQSSTAVLQPRGSEQSVLMKTDALVLSESRKMQLPEAIMQGAERIVTRSAAAVQQPSGSESSTAPVLTKAEQQFFSGSQRTQAPEAFKQDMQPISRRDIRVAGNGLESVAVQEQTDSTAMSGVFTPVSGEAELTFRQEEPFTPQTEGSKAQSSAAARQQTANTERSLSPAYTDLLRTFAAGLTEADLQFLSESQRAQVLDTIRQGTQPIGQRDIRVAGNGLETSVLQEGAEQSAVSSVYPPAGSAEELTFRREEEQAEVQPEKTKVLQSSKDQSLIIRNEVKQTRNGSGEMQQSANAERSVSSTYTNLLRTFAPGLTEADLQFLSEGQRAQVLETIRQGAPSVSSVGGRDIRVTANSPEQAPNPAKTWSEEIRPEELTFRQEAEAQPETKETQPTIVEQTAFETTRDGLKREHRTISPRNQADGSAAEHSLSRDIRVLTEYAEQSMLRTGERTNDGSVGNLVSENLAFLTQDQQRVQGQLSPYRAEPADRMMQAADMENLHYRQMQPEESSGSRTAASDSAGQPQTGQTRSAVSASAVQLQFGQTRFAPADIRILRPLGGVRLLGQQMPEAMDEKAFTQAPSPVDLQLPTGSDAGRQAAE